MKRLDKSEIIFKIISYVFVTLFALATLYPFILSISVAISGQRDVMAGNVVLFPKNVQFEALKEMIIGKFAKRFWIGYTNTIFNTLYGTLFSVFFTVLASYGLSKRKLAYKKQLTFFVVFTMWFSAGMIPTWLNYKDLMVTNRWGMIYGFGIQGFNIILLKNFFQSIPSEIEEAANVDGAGEVQILTSIYLPMSKSVLATITLFYALSRWNGYFWNRILVEPDQHTLQVVLREILNLSEDTEGHSFFYDPKSLVYAAIVLSIIPILIVYPYLQKYFVEGVNVGGVKE